MPPDLPKRVFFFWAQGAQAAPDLARSVWARWAALNPGIKIEILDLAQARDILSALPIDYDIISWAALSDILRIELLATRGGIWCDSSVLPAQALDAWLPADFGPGGVFGFRWNERVRPLASWFLAATPEAPLMQAWRRAVHDYWSVPRRLNPAFGPGRALSEAAFRSVGLAGGTRLQAYPYFWLHNLLGGMLLEDAEMRAAFAQMPDHGALPPHGLDRWMRADALPVTAPRRAVKRALMPLGYKHWKVGQLVNAAPVHKLNFKRAYRPATLATVLARTGPT